MTQRRTCGPPFRPSVSHEMLWVCVFLVKGCMLWVDTMASRILILLSPTMHRTTSGQR